jgi:hypothetical protein
MDTSSAMAQDPRRKVIYDKIKRLEKVTQDLKYHHNALALILCLPPETLTEIFSLLPFPSDDYNDVPYLEWIYVIHVCRRWCEIALGSPYLWSHINFTQLTLAGFSEILAWAKMSPLHFKAKITPRRKARFDAFVRQLEAHIFHTCHLTISGEFQTALERFVSPAPALVSLSLRKSPYPHTSSQYIIPDSLFNGTAPKLTRLELLRCSIRWKSPLLKGLQTLKIWNPFAQEMLTLEDWLVGLNEMSQLETLILDNATLGISIDNPCIPELQRTITLPSLTHFNITAFMWDCALALAHLVLPVLISLHLTAKSESVYGDDVRVLIPYVARNAHGPQDAAPLQTILFNEENMYTEIVVWAVPDADVEVCNSVTLKKVAVSARLVLAVISDSGWGEGMETALFDAMLSHLPLNAITTLSAQNDMKLSKEIWLSHAPRLTKLNRVLLVPTAVRAFREMLEEAAPPNGLPRLPQLTKLILSKVPLTTRMTYHLRNILVKRKEHGAQLETLDVRTCIATDRAIELLSKTVVNMQGPPNTLRRRHPAFFDWEGGFRPFDDGEEPHNYYNCDDAPWHDSTDEDDDEDEFDDYGYGEEEDDEDEEESDDYDEGDEEEEEEGEEEEEESDDYDGDLYSEPYIDYP